MDKDERPRTESSDEAGAAAGYVYRGSDASMLMEMDRYDALTAASSRLAACIVLAGLAILAVTALFIGSCGDNPIAVKVVGIVALAVCAPLVGGLCTALTCQFRFDYRPPAHPQSFAASATGASFDGEADAAAKYAKALGPTFDSLRERNEAVRKLIKAATICLVVSIGLAVAAAIVGICLLPV